MAEEPNVPTGDTEGVADEDIILSTVTITKVLCEDGDKIIVYARDSMGQMPDLVDLLGMIKWAGDAAYHLDPDHECGMCFMFKDVSEDDE